MWKNTAEYGGLVSYKGNGEKTKAPEGAFTVINKISFAYLFFRPITFSAAATMC